MKKYYYLCFAIMFTISLNAQDVIYPYQFSHNMSTYQKLSGGTDAFSGAIWDDTTNLIPIGFDFKWCYDAYKVDSMLLTTSGIFHLKTQDTIFDQFPTSGISMIFADLKDRAFGDTSASAVAKSPITYKTDGVAGDRIFKIQYDNCTFFADTVNSDSINFQLWLYEKNNVIEMRMGPSYIADNDIVYDFATGPHFGLEYKTTLSLNPFVYRFDSMSYITGTPDSFWNIYRTIPINFFTVGPPTEFSMSELPKNGQIFRYTPLWIMGLQNNKTFARTMVYPTNVQNSIVVESDLQKVHYSIYTLDGLLVKKGILENSKSTIEVATLSSSTYLLELNNGKDKEAYKFHKQ